MLQGGLRLDTLKQTNPQWNDLLEICFRKNSMFRREAAKSGIGGYLKKKFGSMIDRHGGTKFLESCIESSVDSLLQSGSREIADQLSLFFLTLRLEDAPEEVSEFISTMNALEQFARELQASHNEMAIHALGKTISWFTEIANEYQKHFKSYPEQRLIRLKESLSIFRVLALLNQTFAYRTDFRAQLDAMEDTLTLPPGITLLWNALKDTHIQDPEGFFNSQLRVYFNIRPIFESAHSLVPDEAEHLRDIMAEHLSEYPVSAFDASILPGASWSDTEAELRLLKSMALLDSRKDALLFAAQEAGGPIPTSLVRFIERDSSLFETEAGHPDLEYLWGLLCLSDVQMPSQGLTSKDIDTICERVRVAKNMLHTRKISWLSPKQAFLGWYLAAVRTTLSSVDVATLLSHYWVEEIITIANRYEELELHLLCSLIRSGLDPTRGKDYFSDLSLFRQLDVFSHEERLRLVSQFSPEQLRMLFGTPDSVGSQVGKEILLILEHMGVDWLMEYLANPQGIKNIATFLQYSKLHEQEKKNLLREQYAMAILLSKTELSEWIGELNELCSLLLVYADILPYIAETHPVDQAERNLLAQLPREVNEYSALTRVQVRELIARFRSVLTPNFLEKFHYRKKVLAATAVSLEEYLRVRSVFQSKSLNRIISQDDWIQLLSNQEISDAFLYLCQSHCCTPIGIAEGELRLLVREIQKNPTMVHELDRTGAKWENLSEILTHIGRMKQQTSIERQMAEALAVLPEDVQELVCVYMQTKEDIVCLESYKKQFVLLLKKSVRYGCINIFSYETFSRTLAPNALEILVSLIDILEDVAEQNAIGSCIQAAVLTSQDCWDIRMRRDMILDRFALSGHGRLLTQAELVLLETLPVEDIGTLVQSRTETLWGLTKGSNEVSTSRWMTHSDLVRHLVSQWFRLVHHRWSHGKYRQEKTGRMIILPVSPQSGTIHSIWRQIQWTASRTIVRSQIAEMHTIWGK